MHADKQNKTGMLATSSCHFTELPIWTNYSQQWCCSPHLSVPTSDRQ